MGMTLTGTSPSNNLGKVVHFSLWVWHPLVEYLETRHYDTVSRMPSLRFNHGEVSADLAFELSEKISIPDASQYTNDLNDLLSSLPNTTCWGCFGFGKKRKGIMVETDDPCTVCHGSGESRPYVAQYRLRAGDVANLKTFLRECGGFRLT